MQFITTGNRIMTENFTVGLFYSITFLNENILACSCNGIGENFVSFLCVEPYMQFILDLSTAETVDTIELYGGGAGTMNYNELNNKPTINGETLVGNLTTTDLHIRAVPTIDTTDNNKVLTASYVGGVTSYAWQAVPTGTTNYNDLTNKPEINGHVLSGNQLPSQLGLATAAQGSLADTAIQPADLASYQPLIDSSHKLSSDLVDDTDHTNKFATVAQLAQIETNKNNILSLIENGGGKNLLPLSITTAQTVNGVIFTPQNDGTIKVTGELNAANAPLVIGTVELPAGTYVLSGSPSGGGESSWQLDTTPTYYQDTGSGISFTINTTTTLSVRIRIAASGTLNLLFKPMISTSTDRTFQPYCPSNYELYQMILAL